MPLAALRFMSEEQADDLATLLVIMIVILVIAVVVMAAGCVCAFFAGAGSRGGQVAWGVVASLEIIAQLLLLPRFFEDVTMMAPAIALVVQTGLYGLGRLQRPSWRREALVTPPRDEPPRDEPPARPPAW